MRITGKLLATLALASSLGACASAPGPLAPLSQQLAGMTRQPDDPAKDAWQTADEMALTRAGDCEDFAAFSHRWLTEHGLSPKLVIGTRPGDGQHAWVEVEVDGKVWYADLDRVSDRRPAWRPLGSGAVEFLRTIKGGPAWPQGVARQSAL